MPNEEIVWLACDECGYGQMFMTNGAAEFPVHICGTDKFVALVMVEEEEDE